MPLRNLPPVDIEGRLSTVESGLDAIDQPFIGASASVAGVAGLVPAPAIGQQNSLLRGNGTWYATGAYGLSFLALAAVGDAYSSLGLGSAAFLPAETFEPAGDYQPAGSYQTASAELSGLASLSSNGVVERTNAGTYATFAVGAFGKVLAATADALAGRTALGLGTAATTADTDYVKVTGDQTVGGKKTFTGYPTTVFSGNYSNFLVKGNLGAFLNFKSTSGASNNDTQFYATGGTASDNQGELQFYGSLFTYYSRVVISNSTASTSTTTGALVVGSGGIGCAGFFTPGDNVSIKIKRLNGTLNALPTTSTSAAHGLSASNIVGAICICKQNGNPSNGFAPGHSLTSANYAFSFNGTNIQIDLNASATTISGGQYEVLLMYRP